MRDLMDLYRRDIESEEFTRREVIVYGVVVPLLIIGVGLLAELISSL